MIHPLLRRQLEQLKIDDHTPPDADLWRQILEHISLAYQEVDDDRHRLENTLGLSAKEAQALEENVQQAEHAARVERDKLQTILNAIGDGLVVLDSEGQMMFMNPATTILLGWEADDFHNKHLFDLLPNTMKDKSQSIEGFVHSHVVSPEKDVMFLRKHGIPFSVSCTLNPLITDEEFKGAVLVFRDISQEKALQEQKDRFIANASHELRTPLSNIITRLYLLRKQPEKSNLHLEVMERTAHYMELLVEELLDASRFERGKIELLREYVTVQDLIMQVITAQEPYAEEKHINLSCHLPPVPVRGYLDPLRIMRVVTNLVVNGINYTLEGGRVDVRTLIRTVEKQSYIIIEVEDTGIGIPSAYLPSQIFEPFSRAYTGTVKGTGLGLTIAKEIVQSHGGSIHVNSQEGQGSIFTVSLPHI